MKNFNIQLRSTLRTGLAFVAFLALVSSTALAQVGINTATPDDDAALHILPNGDAKGLLIPQLSTASRLAIALEGVEDGLMVYDSTLHTFFYWNASLAVWKKVGGAVEQTVFSAVNQNDVISVTGTALVGIWQEGSLSYYPESKSITYTTPGDYTLEDSDSSQIAAGVGELLKNRVDGSNTASNQATSTSNISANSTLTGYPATNLIDGVAGDWRSNGLPSVGTPHIVTYNFGSETLINGFSITEAGGPAASTAPRDFTFEGWDGASWVVLLTVTGQTFAENEEKVYTSTNSTSYSQYRLSVTAVNGGARVAMNTLKLFPPTYSYPVNGFYVTTTANSDITATNDNLIAEVNSVSITGSGSDMKYAISYDAGTTWNYHDGSSWQTMTLSEFATKGSTSAQFTSALTNYTLPSPSATLNVAVWLYTTDDQVNAQIDQIDINYDYQVADTYIKMDDSGTDYSVSKSGQTGSLLINVTKLTSGTHNVVIDYIE